MTFAEKETLIVNFCKIGKEHHNCKQCPVELICGRDLFDISEIDEVKKQLDFLRNLEMV